MKRYVGNAVVAAAVNAIRDERNSRVFREQYLSIGNLIRVIIQFIHERTSHRKKKSEVNFCSQHLNYYV